MCTVSEEREKEGGDGQGSIPTSSPANATSLLLYNRPIIVDWYISRRSNYDDALTYLPEFFLDLGGFDDDRSADGVFHGLDAWVESIHRQYSVAGRRHRPRDSCHHRVWSSSGDPRRCPHVVDYCRHYSSRHLWRGATNFTDRHSCTQHKP